MAAPRKAIPIFGGGWIPLQPRASLGGTRGNNRPGRVGLVAQARGEVSPLGREVRQSGPGFSCSRPRGFCARARRLPRRDRAPRMELPVKRTAVGGAMLLSLAARPAFASGHTAEHMYDLDSPVPAPVVILGLFAPSEIGVVFPHDSQQTVEFALGWSWQVPIPSPSSDDLFASRHHLVGGVDYVPPMRAPTSVVVSATATIADTGSPASRSSMPATLSAGRRRWGSSSSTFGPRPRPSALLSTSWCAPMWRPIWIVFARSSSSSAGASFDHGESSPCWRAEPSWWRRSGWASGWSGGRTVQSPGLGQAAPSAQPAGVRHPRHQRRDRRAGARAAPRRAAALRGR